MPVYLFDFTSWKDFVLLTVHTQNRRGVMILQIDLSAEPQYSLYHGFCFVFNFWDVGACQNTVCCPWMLMRLISCWSYSGHYVNFCCAQKQVIDTLTKKKYQISRILYRKWGHQHLLICKKLHHERSGSSPAGQHVGLGYRNVTYRQN